MVADGAEVAQKALTLLILGFIFFMIYTKMQGTSMGEKFKGVFGKWKTK